MEKHRIEKRKRGWIVTSVSLMLLTACLGISLVFALGNNNAAQQAVERTHEQNLYDLADNLNNLEVNLSKLMIAPDGKFAASLLTDVYGEAVSAERALSALPIDSHSAENASGFLNQVADFAVSYQRTLIAGGSGKGFADNVENMYVTARRLNAEISDSVSLVSQNKLDIRKITASKPYTFRYREKISHNSVEYPELIYDGPFSDGRTSDCYKCLEGGEEITLKEAKDIAVAALSDIKVKKVVSAGKSADEPMYELIVEGERGDAYVSVSQHGGRVMNMSVSRPLGNVMLGENSAKACAKEFAARLGYDVEPVWYLTAGDVAYVNLAPVENDVVMYTDLVKVKVALDNGEALGLEAKNYCLNHTNRNVRLTMNRAAVPTLIDSRLELVNVRGALIPLENGEQRLCYEAACNYKGLDYFVYLDGVNGETVKIMRVVDDGQGSLVM